MGKKKEKFEDFAGVDVFTGIITIGQKHPDGSGFATHIHPDGHLSYEVTPPHGKKVWVLSTLEDSSGRRVYELGGIMHRVGFSEKLTGKTQRFVEEVGVALGQEVENYHGSRASRVIRDRLGKHTETIFDFVTHQKAWTLAAYTTFHAHRDGMRMTQETTGLRLFQTAINEWEYKNPEEKVAVLASIFDTMPDQLKPNALNLEATRKYLVLVEQDITTPVPVYYASEANLFPPSVMTPVKDEPSNLPSWRSSNSILPLTSRLSDFVRHTTYDRFMNTLGVLETAYTLHS